MNVSASCFLSDFCPERKTIFEHFAHRDGFEPDRLAASLDQLHAAGCDGVELVLSRVFQLADIARANETVVSAGMRLLAIHQPVGMFSTIGTSAVETYCRAAGEVGAKLVVVHIANVGKVILEPGFVSRIYELEVQYGVEIAFENGQKFMLRPGAEYSWDPDTVGRWAVEHGAHLTLDTTHLGQVNGNLLDFFARYKDRIVNIHLSDYRAAMFQTSLRPTTHMHMPLGSGTLPVRALINDLKKHRYAGNITLEIVASLDDICAGVRFARS